MSFLIIDNQWKCWYLVSLLKELSSIRSLRCTTHQRCNVKFKIHCLHLRQLLEIDLWSSYYFNLKPLKLCLKELSNIVPETGMWSEPQAHFKGSDTISLKCFWLVYWIHIPYYFFPVFFCRLDYRNGKFLPQAYRSCSCLLCTSFG